MKLSVIVVSLNAGKELKKTIQSVLDQTSDEFEIVIKDGGSTDGSLEFLPTDDRIRLFVQKDRGIYDAMNQAAKKAEGDYVIFMNCGDTFYAEDNISTICRNIDACGDSELNTIFYGDCYTVNRDAIVHYPEVFDDYFCFSKTLCHQATVFPRRLFEIREYQGDRFPVCGDFEFYVNAYCHGTKFKKIPAVLANYEGGGASETVKNRKRAIEEKKMILKENFDAAAYRKNWIKLQLHGKGITQMLAKSKYLYSAYSYLAGVVYREKNK